jgi:hypothetical protein
LKRYIIAVLAVLIAGGGVAAYFIIDHNNDVAHAKAHATAVRQARIDRINRAYHENLRRWRADDAGWTRKNTAYQECETATADAFDAADDVLGVIASGGSRDEYVEPIQDFGGELRGATRAADGLDCLGVLVKLEKAQDKFIDGTNIWLDWIRGDKYQWADKPDDLPMDAKFRKGEDYVSDAETALDAMKPGTRPVKPKRGGSYAPPLDIA